VADFAFRGNRAERDVEETTPEVSHSMSGWWNQLSPFRRLLAFAVAVILAFAVALGIGAVAALMVSGNVSWPIAETTRPDEPSTSGGQDKLAQYEQTDAGLTQQQDSGAKRGQAAPQDERATYVDKVRDIQADAVEAFLDSHKKLQRYDALTSGDVEKMQANQAALKGLADQASALSAPHKYRKHKDVFLSAIDELHQAVQLAYTLAADPISATGTDFEHYDHLVNEADASLQRSDEILGKDYKTIEGAKGVSISQ
jgi:hypothetical protein